MEIVAVIVIVYSAILHEIMHGYIAEKLGDPTARLLGRITLNPIPHIDPVGSILVPFITSLSGIAFGWAKPVPVNPLHLREGRKDLALVALAGPLTNVALAIVAALLLHFTTGFIADVLHVVAYLNLFLAFINLIPIPPLDGSKVFSIILPDDAARAYFSMEQYGFFILLFLLFFPVGGLSLGGFINILVLASLKFLGV